MTPARTLVALGVLAVIPGAIRQAPVVPLSLVPEFLVVRPGTAVRVAIQIDVPDGWHIGWKHPGQSGLPTTVDWRVSPDIRARQTLWPFPERAETLGVVSHVYSGTVLLVSEFEVQPGAPVGRAELVAQMRWGICREICIPQERQTRTTVAVGRGAPELSPRWRALLPALAGRFPVRPEEVGLEVRRVRDGIRVAPQATPEQAVFFPDEAGSGALAVLVTGRVTPAGAIFRVPLRADSGLRGVLVARRSWTAAPGVRALSIDLPP